MNIQPHMTPAEVRALNYHTFNVVLSTVSFSRLSIEENIVKRAKNDIGINCINSNSSTITLHECSIASMDNASVFVASSKLYMKATRAVDCTSAVRIISSTSEAYLTDCFVSKTKAIGVDMRKGAGYLELKRCTIKDCAEQGASLFMGAKKAKILDCKLDNNCHSMSNSEGNLMFDCESVIVKNTTISNSRTFGLMLGSGNGIFDNLVIENCGQAGIMIGPATALISNCTINNAEVGLVLHGHQMSGKVVLDNIVFNDCRNDVYQEDPQGQEIVVKNIAGGEKWLKVISFPDMKEYNGKKLQELKKARRKGEMDADSAWRFSGCQYCAKTLEELGLKKFMVCGGCKIAQYCSTKCQRRSWEMHKPNCGYYQECLKKAKKMSKKDAKKLFETNNKNKDSVDAMMERWESLKTID